jgi:hypothetical protein
MSCYMETNNEFMMKESYEVVMLEECPKTSSVSAERKDREASTRKVKE